MDVDRIARLSHGDMWGVTADPAEAVFGEKEVVRQNAEWVGHRGARYLGAGNLGGEVHDLTLYHR